MICCPTCGKDSFDSEKGMKIHHAKEHDESLVEEPDYADVECPTCGREGFETLGGMRSHHAQLHNKSIAKEIRECSSCGVEQEVYKSGDWKYCLECQRNHEHITEDSLRKLSNSVSGENNPFYGENHSEEQKKKWSEMKSGEDAYFYGVTGEGHPNHGKELTEEHKEKLSNSLSGREGVWAGVTGPEAPMYGVRGEEHPAWKENTTSKYSYLFYENRPKALERDGYECRVCSMNQKENKEKWSKGLTVHHIKPRRTFIDEPDERPPNEAGAMKNLFTVCSSCHQKVESGNVGIPDDGNNMDYDIG